MLDISSRHRPLTLLAVIVLAQVLLLAFQIRRSHEMRLVRLWAAELLTPLQRGGSWAISGLSGGWRNYVDLRHSREETERLQAEVDRLELRNRELEGRAAEAQRLATLLNFREAHGEAPMLAAQVIGANADASSRVIFINRGERDHLRRNLPVITPEGVVGKTVEVFHDTAQVLLLTDRECGVGALFATTRTHGVIKGAGEPLVRMEYVVNGEKVERGAEIVTSGEDRIFPKDLLIGTVESANAGNNFQVIRVKPAARLDRLEEVLVLLTNQELTPRREAETATAVTSSAIPAAGSPTTSPAATTVMPGTVRQPNSAPHTAAKPVTAKPPGATPPAKKATPAAQQTTEQSPAEEAPPQPPSQAPAGQPPAPRP